MSPVQNVTYLSSRTHPDTVKIQSQQVARRDADRQRRVEPEPRFPASASRDGYASAQTGVSCAFLLRFPLSCALQQEKSLLIYAA
jgi:hypothetical protein